MSLSAEQVSLDLGGGKILANVSLAVEPHSVTAVLGPNGAGKSSLLRLLSGELQPSSGVVCIDHERLDALSIKDLARRRSVMVQGGLMAFDFLVEEVLSMGWIHGGGRETRVAPVHEVAAQCGLRELLGRKFRSLSGGERQRVHFARALLQVWPHSAERVQGGPQKPPQNRYLLLDEPTSGLDPAHELSILRLAKSFGDFGIGVLMVLHNVNLAARFADRVLLLRQGETLASGSPGRVFTEDILSRLYETPMFVEQHARLGRVVVHTH